MSPEFFDPERFGLRDNGPTKESDCYALAMVIFEVLSGRVPFQGCDGRTVMKKVVNGERPERPQGPEVIWFTDDVWEMLERCWSPNPKLRPTVGIVSECLERSSVDWRPLSPNTDGDFQLDSDGDSFYTLSHFSCTFPHPHLNPYSLAKPSLANQTILQEDNESSASLPGSPHSNRLPHPRDPASIPGNRLLSPPGGEFFKPGGMERHVNLTLVILVP